MKPSISRLRGEFQPIHRHASLRSTKKIRGYNDQKRRQNFSFSSTQQRRSNSSIPSNRFTGCIGRSRDSSHAPLSPLANNYVARGETRWIGEIDRRDRSRLEIGRVAASERILVERGKSVIRAVRAWPNMNERFDLSIAIEPISGAESSSLTQWFETITALVHGSSRVKKVWSMFKKFIRILYDYIRNTNKSLYFNLQNICFNPRMMVFDHRRRMVQL